MNDETVENSNIENNPAQEEKENTSTEHITLESLANEMAAIKNDFNERIREKEQEISILENEKNKLKEMLNEQNALIGNFKETVFNSAKITPEMAVKPDEAHLKQCYEDAFKTAYQWSKHRLIGNNNDEKLFVNRCMRLYNDNV